MDTSIYEPTCEEGVFIEERKYGYVKYIRVKDDEIIERWEVTGICIDLGHCYEGANGPKPELDCPVYIGFNGCCPLIVNLLYQK